MVEHVRPATQSHAEGARQFDRESRAWLESLPSDGARYDAAISRLHALLLSEARYQFRRGTTRLLERGRGVGGPGLAEQLGFGPYLRDPIGFAMSQKMLRTVKRLAETSQR